MSDYKRFVSYLYEYIAEKKSENRGFVKVELRFGICHMQFQMKVFSLPPHTPVMVYGFIQTGQTLQGVLLGHLNPSKNGISGTITLPAQIPDTSYQITDFNGLILTAAGEKFYGTQWDETPILPSLFQPIPSTEEDEKPEPDQPESDQPIPDQSAPDQSAPDQPKSRQSEETFTETETASSRNPSGSDKHPDLSQQSISVTSANAAPKETPWDWARQRYNAIYPFDDDEICDCIRISPADFPGLRAHGFPLGCNQFIHHGFQNYHHLLLGRTHSGHTTTCVLGVPGIYNPNEQFMASMFGFCYFKPGHLPKEYSFSGKTGYWYRPLL